MKIYDCFQYLDEDVVLELRFNYLDKFVDKFVIVESKYTHSGKKRDLTFNINRYPEFKKKINYLVLDKEPSNLEIIKETDNEEKKNNILILNPTKRELLQRELLMNGIKEASKDDLIMLSDVDEIPKLENLNLNDITEKFIFFKQKMFYYKFNLCSESIDWTGTKACKKKDLLSFQWLRNIKSKYYSIWRLDTLLNKKKYTGIRFIKDGGWHFSYIKTPEGIEEKLRSYAHHREYDLNPVGKKNIAQKIKNKESIYNLDIDMRMSQSRFSKGQSLSVVELSHLPSYIKNNQARFKEWLA